MTEQERNKKVIVDLIAAADDGDLERVAAAYADDYRDHAREGSRGNGDKDATLGAFAEIRRAFPDTKHGIDDLIAENDRVVLRVHALGTHTAPFRGRGPTGRRVRMQTTAIYRLRDGRIVERWCDGVSAIAEQLDGPASEGAVSGRVEVLRGRESPWRRDVEGASFQEVVLEQLSLTCFRLDPGTRFDAHAHASEQITYVLDGQLAFDVEGTTYRLEPGDAIAIPSDVPHGVVAGHRPVLALDAWSPPHAHLGR